MHSSTRGRGRSGPWGHHRVVFTLDSMGTLWVCHVTFSGSLVQPSIRRPLLGPSCSGWLITVDTRNADRPGGGASSSYNPQRALRGTVIHSKSNLCSLDKSQVRAGQRVRLNPVRTPSTPNPPLYSYSEWNWFLYVQVSLCGLYNDSII